MSRFRVLLREIGRGKGIARTLLNLEVQARVRLRGRVLDLGGGKHPSYYRFLGYEYVPQNVVRVDLVDANRPDCVAHLDTGLPFRSGSIDQVLLFNVLEHIYEHRQLLVEIRRVLKDEGELYLYVPFLIHIHGDPDDFFRYTESALSRLLNDAGFVSSTVYAHSGLLLVLADFSKRLVPVRWLQISYVALALIGQKWLTRVAPRFSATFVLGYFVHAQSSAAE